MEQPGGATGASHNNWFIEKRPEKINLWLAGLFSLVNYLLSIIIKETMIAIKVPKATIRDNDS